MKDLSVFITVVYRHIYNQYKVTLLKNIVHVSEFMLQSLSVTVKLYCFSNSMCYTYVNTSTTNIPILQSVSDSVY